MIAMTIPILQLTLRKQDVSGLKKYLCISFCPVACSCIPPYTRQNVQASLLEECKRYVEEGQHTVVTPDEAILDLLPR